ncbi:MAG TPA: NAD-dependent epimerase/dehydratase family protein [Mycobacterium sp.]|nr:NAD-dependent epimerase/dehydratase family protein [Mycobacterium sp.]
MRILVTGAAGFIGSTLVDRLLSDGHQVVGVDNLSTGVAANLELANAYNALSPRRFTLVPLDIQAPELTGVVEGTNPDVIFHLAAQADLGTSVSDPLFDARSNVLGTINLCEASRRAGVRRIIYAACSGSDGMAVWPSSGENMLGNPLSPYAAAKLAGEMYLRAYAAMYGLAPICLELATVYGPRQRPRGPEAVTAILGSAMLTGRPFAVYRDSSVASDYVYVDDVVEAFMCAGSAPMEITGTYTIGTGRQTTLHEVQRLICAVVDAPTAPVPAMSRDGGTHVATLEIELGWKPTIDLAEGIERTFRWLCATREPATYANAVEFSEGILDDDLVASG